MADQSPLIHVGLLLLVLAVAVFGVLAALPTLYGHGALEGGQAALFHGGVVLLASATLRLAVSRDAMLGIISLAALVLPALVNGFLALGALLG